MSSNLYEILGISRDATTEESIFQFHSLTPYPGNANNASWWHLIVRKAYKKRALATHPDRFAGKSEAEKSLAEEQFRKVSSILGRHVLQS